MCGRFIQAASGEVLTQQLGLMLPADYAPRYNVAPNQTVLAIRATENGRQPAWLRWGLIPAWAREPRLKYSTINARAETVAEKPAYRQAFRQRRCLIPADGFYEWRKVGDRKQPYCIGMADGAPFAFAGLWEHWARDDEAVDSCTILVTQANERISEIHDRMPVILDPLDYDAWLDPTGREAARVLPLLRSYPGERMRLWPVGSAVNRPANQGPALMEPVG
ncbi:MAG: SOS response-associated peptidase [Candidatus Competibacteraceae bacterium]|nr:SOS response-associated peptidase [Candidatus Competibacteraceae bacterium]MBK7982091.1 SOS response-associated peptidase [Candidatus Competibacteraceae bacterium]MBK8963399.1 SOS response-associated peptidase [Candidatus Competibacteraceae bacterium]